MANSSERTTPETPPTERALPPGGATAATARTEARSVPGPAERGRTTRATVRGNGRPSNPVEMRREIEETRTRMSHTLDAIEARIVHERRSLERQKDQLVDRVMLKGVRQKLRQEPWRSMAIAFAAGYIIAAIRD